MIKCPNPDCGFENVDGTQYCEACGEELSQNGASNVTTASANTVRCPACDNVNPADNVVCEVCGADLKPATNVQATGSGASGASNLPIGAASSPMTGDAGMTDATAPASPQPASTTPFDAGLGGALGAGTGAPTGTGLASPPATTTMGDAATTGAGTGAALPTVDTSDISNIGAGNSPVVMAGDTASPIASTATPLAPDPVMSTPPASLAPTTTAPDATATAPTVPTTSGDLQPGKVKLTVEQGMSVGAQFVLGDNRILVGREDADEQIYPDVDLSDQDAGYVHRKHAELNFQNGKLTVTHLGGVNKTRINNRPLPDNDPQELNIGDKVAFGKVVLRVGAA